AFGATGVVGTASAAVRGLPDEPGGIGASSVLARCVAAASCTLWADCFTCARATVSSGADGMPRDAITVFAGASIVVLFTTVLLLTMVLFTVLLTIVLFCTMVVLLTMV